MAITEYGIGHLANQDVPDHKSNDTSSIGPLWPPQRTSFNRIKGFYDPGIIDNTNSLNYFRSVLELLKLDLRSDISRISLRAIIDNSLIPDDPNIECIIPLDSSTSPFEQSSLVYFGCNHESRRSDISDLHKTQSNLEQAMKYSRRSPEEVFSRIEENDYSLDIAVLPIDFEERENIISQMHNLYSRFGWNRKEVEEILNRNNNKICIARHSDQIVSAGIAEFAMVTLGNNRFRMVEITEAATLEEHGSNGLYTAVSFRLLSEICKISQRSEIFGGELDLVFGECNGLATGVLKTSIIQGRRFAANTTPNYLENKRGILHQHVSISGPKRSTPYNDLYPSFLTTRELYHRFEQK